MERIHFIGIGGTGMGPLAKVFVEMGCRVSGSDLQSSETTQYLEGLGAAVFYGHRAAHVENCDTVVFSSAIPRENPELEAAHRLGLRVLHRSEVLAQLLNTGRGVAVAGAHGKTTITAMISWILENLNFDPTVLIGARFTPFGPGAKFGKGDLVVAEADESDRSFLRYRPEVGIVTSIEPDHLENYNGAFEQLIDGYDGFMANTVPGGLLLLGVDDPILAKKAPTLKQSVLGYGFKENADWRGEILAFDNGGATFRVLRQGTFFGDFSLSVPGRHNVANALAALAVGHHFGLTAEAMRPHLATFSGAQRRFQILGEQKGIMVVDDYAHHPTEIAATIRAAHDGWSRRIIAVFQPQRYTRTELLFDDFVKCFDEADEIVLTDIYSPPPEKPIPGVTAANMAEQIRQRRGRSVSWVGSQDFVVPALLAMVREGDLVITMGAGPIWKAGLDLLRHLKDSSLQ